MNRFEWRIVGSLVAIYVVHFFTICVQKFRAYSYGDFDLPIFHQGLWSTLALDGFFRTSIRFGHVFSDHLSLILIPILPIYGLLRVVMPGPIVLLLLQTLALGSGAIPLYLIARGLLGKSTGVAVVACYLLYPALGYMNLFEFHPGAFATCFLLWTLYFLHVRKWRWFVAFTALSLSCREDVALPVIMVGAWALFATRDLGLRGSAKWVLVPCVAGLLYFWLAVSVIVPAFNPDGSTASPFVQLYSYLAVDRADYGDPGVLAAVKTTDIISAVVFHPLESLGKASELKGGLLGRYVLQLIAPTAGISLLAPLALLPALPNLVLNLLSAKTSTCMITYHYAANIIPFIFLAMIHGLAFVRRRLRAASPWVAGLVVATAVTTSGLWGPQFTWLRGSDQASYSNETRREFSDVVKDQMVERLAEREQERAREQARRGDRASLVTSFELMHHVPMRSMLHSWHYVRSGRDPVTGRPVHTPQTDFALLDFRDELTFSAFTNDQSGSSQRAFFQEGDWKIVEQTDSLVLFERGAGSGDVSSLIAVVPNEPRPREVPADLVPVRPETDLGLRIRGIVVESRGSSLVLKCRYSFESTAGRRNANAAAPLRRAWSSLRMSFAVDVGGRTVYDEAWPLAYTLVDPAEWVVVESVERGPSLLVTYPLGLEEPLPRGGPIEITMTLLTVGSDQVMARASIRHSVG